MPARSQYDRIVQLREDKDTSLARDMPSSLRGSSRDKSNCSSSSSKFHGEESEDKSVGSSGESSVETYSGSSLSMDGSSAGSSISTRYALSSVLS